ncbi:MAG: MFS transporter, partial [Desulfovibrionaceae bacterium]|nr:MFS transporter [Desulfovibrionaceae bacterium]
MSTSPRMPAGAAGQSQTLLSRDFLLLFFLVLCANCYMAIYYCFEQWLEEALVPAGWRGLLLGALFGMVLVTRPAATVLLLKADRLLPMLLSMLFSSAVLFSYQFMPQDSPAFVWILLFVRLLQGFCLAVFSSCAVSLLVTCIPPGQSARGFALFSLTTLIPYAVAPSAGELLLPLV